MSPVLFISHSSKDEPFLDRELIPFLQQNEFECWYSKDSIPTAAEWHTRIVDGLKTCDWFVVAISRHAAASEWVKDEVYWAVENRPNRILPLLLDSTPPADLHMRLTRIQQVPFHVDLANLDDARAKILSALRGDTPAKPAIETLNELKSSLTQRMANQPDGLSSDDMRNLINDTIQCGSGFYNHGHMMECAQIYLNCARTIIEKTIPSLPAAYAEIAQIELAFVKSPELPVTADNADDLAWQMRQAFNNLLLMPEVERALESLDTEVNAIRTNSTRMTPSDLFSLVHTVTTPGYRLFTKSANVSCAVLYQRTARAILALMGDGYDPYTSDDSNPRLAALNQLRYGHKTRARTQLESVEHVAISKDNAADVTQTLYDSLTILYM